MAVTTTALRAEDIRSAVFIELTFNTEVRWSEIGAIVDDHVATLDGPVDRLP